MQRKLLALILVFQGFVFADQQSQVSSDLLTQQLKDEYAAYYKLCSDTLPNFDIIMYLIIAEQQKNMCPVLHNMVQTIATELNLAVPQILISKLHLGNAMALQDAISPEGKMIIGSDLINDLEYGLTYDELRAVVAHELAHLKHQHVPKRIPVIQNSLAIMVGSAVAISLFAKSLPYIYEKLNITDYQFKAMGKNIPGLTKHNLITLLTKYGLCIATGVAAILPFQKFCRDQEKEADMTSIGVTKDPMALVSALSKIYKLSSKINPKLHVFKHKPPNALSSHPAEAEREEYLKAAAIEMNS